MGQSAFEGRRSFGASCVLEASCVLGASGVFEASSVLGALAGIKLLRLRCAQDNVKIATGDNSWKLRTKMCFPSPQLC